VKHIVGVADAVVSNNVEDVIVTHALGSCLGITIYDPIAKVGGLLHVMMPLSSIDPAKGKKNPSMFIDTGVPAFFRKAYEFGAKKRNLKVKVAGGANIQTTKNDHFAIGKRNYIVLKKIFWKNGIMIDAEDVGGTSARTVHMEIATGKVWLSIAGQKTEL
jgi:chemotaxis protein CheD